MTELTKICTKCREEKPLSEYWPSKTGKHGKHSQCKNCKKKYHQGRDKRRKEILKKIDLGQLRKCSKCGKTKQLSEFPTHQRGKDGRDASCKNCHLEAKHEYLGKADNQQKRLTYYQKRYRMIRARAVYHLGGPKCVHCGYSDIRALEIDHIDGGGTKEYKALGGGLGVYTKILKLPEEDARKEYQVLCANCNSIKRLERGETGRS